MRWKHIWRTIWRDRPHAIDLLEAIRNRHAGESLGEFAAELLPEIEEDRDVLRRLADRVGAGSNSLKEIGGWLSEKIMRLKLQPGSGDDLGTFEALEFLELGIHGKWALWRALRIVAEGDARLRGEDYERLTERAESQRNRVEQRRLEIAPATLRAA